MEKVFNVSLKHVLKQWTTWVALIVDAAVIALTIIDRNYVAASWVALSAYWWLRYMQLMYQQHQTAMENCELQFKVFTLMRILSNNQQEKEPENE